MIMEYWSALYSHQIPLISTQKEERLQQLTNEASLQKYIFGIDSVYGELL